MLAGIGSKYPWVGTISWWLLQFGLNPRRTVQALVELPRYLKDLRRFRRSYNGEIRRLPSLHDRGESAGQTSDEYFWQDLSVAQEIFRRNPRRHLDVGSRFDGFIAHVASFREVEVVDIRPMQRSIPNVTFRQADMMGDHLGELAGSCDSLSCLHAIEHFGLGRYGDPLNAEGHVIGLRNLARLLEPGGVLYLGCPIGVERVEYNSHRILDPEKVVSIARECGLTLEKFSWVDPSGYHQSADNHDAKLAELARRAYALGIYTFRRAA